MGRVCDTFNGAKELMSRTDVAQCLIDKKKQLEVAPKEQQGVTVEDKLQLLIDYFEWLDHPTE